MRAHGPTAYGKVSTWQGSCTSGACIQASLVHKRYKKGAKESGETEGGVLGLLTVVLACQGFG